MTKPKVFFYVQHLLGIGHLVRANRIATTLHRSGFDVVVASGGMPVPGFPGPGPRLVQLPALKSGAEGFSDLQDAGGRSAGDDFKAARREALLSAAAEFVPEIVIVEAFPFGRRAMRFELLPLLAALKERRPAPLICCSIRDILQDSYKPGRAEEAVGTLNRFFDLVMVHGDPRFATLGETFPLAGAINCEVAHTGLVAGGIPPPADDRYDAVVSAGGGAAGAKLLETALDMLRQSRRNLRWCVITGPNAPASLLERNAIPNVDIFRFRLDLPSLLLNAKLSISQAGYNTVCDVLRAGCRMLLVPFAAGGETEQTARAERLKQLSLAEWIAEDSLDAARLSYRVDGCLADAAPPPHGLDLAGAEHTAELLMRRMEAHVRRP